MPENDKYRILSLSAYQPDSITDYRTAQIAAPKDFDYDEYQRRMDMIKRGQEIQNLGLYEQAGIENTGLPYYQVGERDTELTPEKFASFAEREGYDPEDYYTSLEWMSENVAPLTKNLNDFQIGLAGAKEGLSTPLRQQLLGPQHASTRYGSFEWSPEQVSMDRSERRVFPQRTLQTKANPRAGKEATYLETQGTLAYPAWEKAYKAGTVKIPWEQGVAEQRGFVAGDAERYDADAAEEVKGKTTVDKSVKPQVKWTDKVLMDQSPYTYGGRMKKYFDGGALTQMATLNPELLTTSANLATNVGEMPGISGGGSPWAMVAQQGANLAGQFIPETEETDLDPQQQQALSQYEKGKDAVVGGLSMIPGAGQFIALGAAAGKTIKKGGKALEAGADSDFGKGAGRAMQYIADPMGSTVETFTDPRLTTQGKLKEYASKAYTFGIKDDLFGKTDADTKNIPRPTDKTQFNYGAYGGNLYAMGGLMEPTIDPEHKKKYKSQLRVQENDAKEGMETLEKWTKDFPSAEKWTPYTAVEDKKKKNPTYDIGYGHKLGKKKDGKLMVTIDGKEVDAMKGLNTKQIEALLDQDITAHEDIARKQWNARYPDGTQYDDLDQDMQVLITDYAFNLGNINKFPSFMDALSENDKDKAYKEYRRSTGGKPMKRRNTWAAAQLDKIFVKPETKATEPNQNITPTTNTPAVAESTGVDNTSFRSTEDVLRRQRLLDNARKVLEESRKQREQLNKKAYGGDLEPMPMMSPQPLPVNTPGVQPSVWYREGLPPVEFTEEGYNMKMQNLYNPQKSHNRRHTDYDTKTQTNTNNIFDKVFRPNTAQVSASGYAYGGNIDNLYQAGGNLTEYNGNRHEVGGIPLGNTNNEVEDGEIRWDTPDGESYIFSDRIPYTKSKKK